MQGLTFQIVAVIWDLLVIEIQLKKHFSCKSAPNLPHSEHIMIFLPTLLVTKSQSLNLFHSVVSISITTDISLHNRIAIHTYCFDFLISHQFILYRHEQETSLSQHNLASLSNFEMLKIWGHVTFEFIYISSF